MEIDKQALGARIKAIRVTRKETLESFSNKINEQSNGVINSGKSNVSRWEKGENIPNALTLQAIADLGERSVQNLLYGSIVDHYKGLLNAYKKNLISESSLDATEVALLIKQLDQLYLNESVSDPVNSKNNLKGTTFVNQFKEKQLLEKHFRLQSQRLIEEWMNPTLRYLHILEELDEQIDTIINDKLRYIDDLKVVLSTQNDSPTGCLSNLFDELKQLDHSINYSINELKEKYSE